MPPRRVTHPDSVMKRLYNNHLDESLAAYNRAFLQSSIPNPLPRIEAEIKNSPIYSDRPSPIFLDMNKLVSTFDLEEYACWKHEGQFQNGYPVVSIRTDWNNSTKIELHRWSLLCDPEDPNQPIMDKKMTASHLCHNKACIRPTHIVCESIPYNASRNHCVCWTIINDQLVCTCLHDPPCLFSGSQRPQ